jgi:poly-beta-hydroxyalkanoate depolymerase
VLAATALMAEREHPAQPRSMTLMAGPIDCRVNPTAVNELATSKPIDWFDKHADAPRALAATPVPAGASTRAFCSSVPS